MKKSPTIFHIFLSFLLIGGITTILTHSLNAQELDTTGAFQNEPHSEHWISSLNYYVGNAKNREDVISSLKTDLTLNNPSDFSDHVYLEEYLTIVHLLRSNNSKLLPIDEFQMMTYELASDLHMRMGDYSFETAKKKKYIPNNVKKTDLMSRKEYIDMVVELYLKGKTSDGFSILTESGVITKPSLWRMTDHEGFPLVEGVVMTLRIKDFIEKDSWMQEKSSPLPLLPEGTLSISDESIAFIIQSQERDRIALLSERQQERLQISKRIQKAQQKLSPLYGKTITSEIIDYLLKSTEDKQSPQAFIIPGYIDLGNCKNDLHEKLSLGSFSKTSQLGALMVCETSSHLIGVQIPPSSYIFNFDALPSIQEVTASTAPNTTLIEAQLSRMAAEMVIIGNDGEKRLSLKLTAKEPSTAPQDYQFFIRSAEKTFDPITKTLQPENITSLDIPLRSLQSDFVQIAIIPQP